MWLYFSGLIKKWQRLRKRERTLATGMASPISKSKEEKENTYKTNGGTLRVIDKRG